MNNGSPLGDPDPAMSPAQVKDFYAAMYPELLNAEIKGPETSEKEVTYTFHRTTGTKGAGAKASRATPPKKTRPSKVLESFLRGLEIAAGEARKSQPQSPQLSAFSKALKPKGQSRPLWLSGSELPLIL